MAKILVIDDDPGIRSYFSRLLIGLGYEVQLAENSPAGLAGAADPGISLVIADLNLPGEPSGTELIRKLREQRADCPVVVVSGYPTTERLKTCEELGVAEFLTKPFEMSFIASVLKRLIPQDSKA